MSELLVHFTGRARQNGGNLPVEIRQARPQNRLESILRSRTIKCWNTYFADVLVVCFTESTISGLEYLIAEAGFQPWGIVFNRQMVFDRGGGPVFHLRGDEWANRVGLSPRFRSRFIRFQPGESEWLDEREWRVPYDQGDVGFQFGQDQVAALIVGERDWPPPVLDEQLALLLGLDIAAQMPAPPPWVPARPRWWWNQGSRRLEIIS